VSAPDQSTDDKPNHERALNMGTSFGGINLRSACNAADRQHLHRYVSFRRDSMKTYSRHPVGTCVKSLSLDEHSAV